MAMEKKLTSLPNSKHCNFTSNEILKAILKAVKNAAYQ